MLYNIYTLVYGRETYIHTCDSKEEAEEYMKVLKSMGYTDKMWLVEEEWA